MPDSTPATATGWRIAALKGRVYPGLVAGHHTVSGHLLTGLSAGEWHTVDAFEDEEYELQRLTLTDGRHGWAYIYGNPEIACTQDWDAQQFAGRELPAYIERCLTWRRQYDAATR